MKHIPPKFKAGSHHTSTHDSRLTTHDLTHDSRLSKASLKDIQKLHLKKYRTERSEVLVEGKRLLDQIHKNGIVIKQLFCLESEKELYDYLLPESIMYGEPWQLEKLAQTKSSQQVIGLIEAQRQPVLKSDFLLYLDNISEPGNLGTIFRTALGLGVQGIITSPGCCELFNPKAIRASMGAVLTLPSEEHEYEWLFEQPGKIMVTCLENSQPLTSLKTIPKPAILVIGSEAHGIDLQIIDRADIRLKIPMTNDMESLNAAVAAGIAIFYLTNNEYLKR
jgi:RNA methyltransferase, TrmH family